MFLASFLTKNVLGVYAGLIYLYVLAIGDFTRDHAAFVSNSEISWSCSEDTLPWHIILNTQTAIARKPVIVGIPFHMATWQRGFGCVNEGSKRTGFLAPHRFGLSLTFSVPWF